MDSNEAYYKLGQIETHVNEQRRVLGALNSMFEELKNLVLRQVAETEALQKKFTLDMEDPGN